MGTAEEGKWGSIKGSNTEGDLRSGDMGKSWRKVRKSVQKGRPMEDTPITQRGSPKVNPWKNPQRKRFKSNGPND